MDNQPENIDTTDQPKSPVLPEIVTAQKKKRRPFFIYGLIVFILAAGAGTALAVKKNSKKADRQSSSGLSLNNAAGSPSPSASVASPTPAATKISLLEEGKIILSGGYADPTVVPMEGGYRMYVNRQSNGPGGYLTYTSPDGIAWKKEKDIIIPQVATGRAVVLPTGIRFYYPGVQPIKPSDPPADMYSSFSKDGVTFTKDPGVILSPRTPAHYVEGPTVFQLPDKTWRMYFNENTTAASNQRDGIIWGASSSDGLTWTRDATLTMEADNTESVTRSPWKQVLHPFVLANPKGGYIMFYNTHSEIYAATSTDGISWKKIGYTGIHGADIDGYFQADGTIRVYYGDFNEKTGGLVYGAVFKVQ
jgi:hypothetical protein